MIGVLVPVFFILLVLSVPVGHVLLMASGASIMAMEFLPLNIIVQQMFGQTQSFPMLALPFFILAGNLMMSGALGQKLIRFASMLVQRYRGGPLSASVVGSAVFGGVSGSAVADATALGSMLIPWQKGEGFPADFAAANNASSAMLAVLIPPSIPMILYALVSGTSVAALFTAGILPGLMITVGFIGVCSISARLRGFPYRPETSTWAEIGRQTLFALPALMTPVMIVVLLRFGFATPTEVSVLATLYAFLVSLIIYRDMTLGRLTHAVLSAGVATGVVMLVIMGSAVIGWLLTYAQIPQTFATWAAETLNAPWLIILAMLAIMLVVGMFIDLPAAILLLGPIFVPLANQIGLDPVQFGIMMVLALAIGLFTPPVGTTLFISSSIARVPILNVVREMWPFYAVSLLILLGFSFVPALTIH
ncbi:TRAP transporter large permease [Nitratireductor luteus]|uniref:TRAP transporter large permease n=1 Tax=Nitratireductor luteus TaxID=2976980 RepID=UPI00223F7590|nr:TRAP transporter large permease [Nitratireductor luteus]